jgi:hypothetical protein
MKKRVRDCIKLGGGHTKYWHMYVCGYCTTLLACLHSTWKFTKDEQDWKQTEENKTLNLL